MNAVVLHNKAKAISLEETPSQASFFAESGANLTTINRQAVQKNLTGLEWAAGIPGTLGGAIYGNAGAHGGEISHNLILADILHRKLGRVSLSVEEMAFSYRSSVLKRAPGIAVILSARLSVKSGDPEGIRKILEKDKEKRQKTQPTGPSMGSMFKNPVGDSAGRLIDAAGLKGTRIGGVEVSPIHANFMINNGTATAQDYRKLVTLVQQTVQEKFNVKLELEIEVLGNWQG
jgi:UDP-N-acetylmuramate dehydrogenase